MSDTGAAAWQWTQMLPLTLWSLPLAEALHQHQALSLAAAAGAALTDVYKTPRSCQTVHH